MRLEDVPLRRSVTLVGSVNKESEGGSESAFKETKKKKMTRLVIGECME